MKHQEFKSGDLVENIHTGEVEMIYDVYNDGRQILIVDSLDEGRVYFYHSYTDYFHLLSPKKVKFNLK